MTWEQRIRQCGAPGPMIVDQYSETHTHRVPLAEVSPAPAERHESRSAGAIIVGVDGSERSADAIALADWLAESLEGELVFVYNHPYGAPSTVGGSQEDEQLMRSISDTTFAQVHQLVRHDHEPGIRVTHAVSPAIGLQQIAEHEHAQLIVVGPSHRSGLGRVRPGSIGERLLYGAPVPIAIAPTGYARALSSLGLIACGFDGSPESHLAFNWAAQLAQASGGRLWVISAHMPMAYGGLGFGAESVDPIRRRDLEHEQQAAIADYRGQVEATVLDGDPARTLVEVSQEANLLVMGSRGFGPLQSTLLGGVSQYVVRHAACPVVIHPRSELRAANPQPLFDHVDEPAPMRQMEVDTDALRHA